MKDETTCKALQPEPGQTLQQAATLLADGWCAAQTNEKQGGPTQPDWLETEPRAFQEGWALWNQTGRFKALRLGLLQ